MINLSKSFCFAIVFFFLLLSQIFGQVESARDAGAYIGQVRTVRTEFVKYSFDEGRLKAGKRKLEQIEIFDKAGNYLRNLEYADDGVPNWDEKTIVVSGRVMGWQSSDPHYKWPPDEFLYKYDDSGNLIEQYTNDEDGRVRSQWKYQYDKQKRKVAEIYILEKPLEQTSYSYDEKGRLIEESKFVIGDKGLVPRDKDGYHRKVLIYTTGVRWDVALKFLANGQLVDVSRLSRDSKGNETEDFEFDAKGSLKNRIRYEYKFDRRGNWIEQKTFRWKTVGAISSYQLDEISYRVIRYFIK